MPAAAAAADVSILSSRPQPAVQGKLTIGIVPGLQQKCVSKHTHAGKLAMQQHQNPSIEGLLLLLLLLTAASTAAAPSLL
jgi:hypothetical protein